MGRSLVFFLILNRCGIEDRTEYMSDGADRLAHQDRLVFQCKSGFTFLVFTLVNNHLDHRPHSGAAQEILILALNFLNVSGCHRSEIEAKRIVPFAPIRHLDNAASLCGAICSDALGDAHVITPWSRSERHCPER
jgi:hypothetical protein